MLPLAEGRAFLERWQAFMDRHGHHTRGEVELMNPRWRETPDVVLGMARHYLEVLDHHGAVPAVRVEDLAEQRAATERECLARLKNPLKRLLFRWTLSRARRGVIVKENVKSDLVRVDGNLGQVTVLEQAGPG